MLTETYGGEGYNLGSERNARLDECCLLGYKIGSAACKSKCPVGVMTKKSTLLSAMKNALIGGLILAGATAYDLGDGFLELCCFAAAETLCEKVVYIATGSEGKITASVFSRHIGKANKEIEVTAESDFKGFFPSEKLFEVKTLAGLRHFYISELVKSCEDILCGESLEGISVSVSGFMSGVLIDALRALRAEIKKGDAMLKIALYENEPLAEAEQGETICDCRHMNAIVLNHLAKSGEDDFVLPYLSPEIYRKILLSNGAAPTDFSVFSESAADFTHSMLLKSMFLSDKYASVIKFAALLKISESNIAELSQTVPKFHVFTAEFDGRNAENDSREEIRLAFKDGRVTVIPKRDGGYKLISEAESVEAAKELCFEAESFLK